jgi:predicted nucleic acid-binding protein
MITAVDTNVLLDVLGADPRYGPRSRAALDQCLDQGSLLVCDVVWAETSAAFPDPDAATSAFATLGAAFSPSGRDAALAAGIAWRAYRAAGGPRTRVVADFLVGAHAAVQADRLLTRDRGFHRSYFGTLTILDPTS